MVAIFEGMLTNDTLRSNILAGANPGKILDNTGKMLRRKKDWANPFGCGKAAKMIINILLK